ncbi:MAG: glycoside hydrolase family 97 catalytic domain-containing protein [Chitinophagaceae bacterium]|nr:glycoside hydrolase family 97 catalytic domain-containing protein [Chitinophagaceae bacterium]
MNRILLILSFFFVSSRLFSQGVVAGTENVLTSPDGNYRFSFCQKKKEDSTKQMYYTVSFKGKEVILESELGILIENRLFESALGIPNDTLKYWGDNLELTGVDTLSANTTWMPVYGERSLMKDQYKQLVLKFRKGSEEAGEMSHGYDKRRYYYVNVEVRAYNEGIAFRYHFPEAVNGLFLHITGEQSQFILPEGTLAYHESWAQGPVNLLPLKNWKDEAERPLTLKLKNGLTVSLAEANMITYTRGKFALNKTKINALQLSMYASADVITPYNTPWRVIMAAERPVDLINNNHIILNLNPENKIKDVSWIKPGKVIRSGLSQAEARDCIDFAEQRGLQYVHLDAGWYGPEMSMSSDATKVRPDKDIDFPALTKYAAEKGIGIFVYVNQRALYQQLDSLLPVLKKWGIKGIKFGFVQIGNQQWSTWLHNAVKKCADYGMLVDIHDEYRPTGFSRTYPNLLTQEGIRGNEEMPDATHNTILPFTRFIAGAGDYTICYYNNRIKTTHAHQLALAAIYYSPLQFLYWYDNPTMYNGEPEIEFFDNVKTVWDDTKALDGAVGEFVTVARRSGEDWFVGSITNNEARTVAVDLSFLPPGKKYEAKIYSDDDKINTKTKVRVDKKVVTSGTKLNVELKASGGQAMWLSPVK